MEKKLTFKEFLEKEKNREDILRGASRLDEVLESARRINDISLSSRALEELNDRSNKLKSIIDDSSFSAIREAAERIKVDTSSIDRIAKSIDTSSLELAKHSHDKSAVSSFTESYKSLINSITPVSKLYASELQKLRASIEAANIKNILTSESFNKAKELQNELIRLEPNIGIQPITTLEKSIESDNPDPFEKAMKDVNTIELLERLKVSNADAKQLEENPFKGSSVDILIVTGLPLELRIFCDVFSVDSRWHSDKFVSEYYFGVVRSDCTKYTVALVFGQDMGNFYASQATNAGIEDLNPKIVISAGIGYTLNPSSLQLCDLHVTDSIVYWGLTSKEYEDSGRKVRAIPVQVKSNHLYQEIRKYVEGLRSGKTSYAQWRESARYDRPTVNLEKVNGVLKEINKAVKCGVPNTIYNELPKVEVGKTMVSDDAVIASIDQIRKRSLFDAGNENHISGEMEAAGVAMSIYNRRSMIEFIAIRGISDFGFGKEALESSSNDFRLIAAVRAASFIKGFFESDPTLAKNASGILPKLGEAIA